MFLIIDFIVSKGTKMPTWKEYKKESVERGSLAFEVYCVHSKPAGEMSAVKQNLPAHLAYQAEQEKKGTLMLAGPVSDLSGELMEGEGQIIYRTASLEEALKITENDPMHLSGARSFTIRRWLINEGSFQLDLKLSTRRINQYF